MESQIRKTIGDLGKIREVNHEPTLRKTLEISSRPANQINFVGNITTV